MPQVTPGRTFSVVSGLKLSGCALPTEYQQAAFDRRATPEIRQGNTAVDESYLEAKSDAVLMTMWG
jgi:hypothetical protein